MIAVRMVQTAVHKIVDVVTMRHLFMTAVWTVHVCAGDFRRAVHGICGVHRDDMFVHVILMHVVEMAVVKVVHMAIMANRSVPAVRAMPVGMIGMMLLGAGRHLVSFLLFGGIRPELPRHAFRVSTNSKDSTNATYCDVPPFGSD